MRRLFVLLFVCALALPLRAAVPPLLEAAIGQLAVNFDHWAYTETYVMRNAKGKELNHVVWRFDPSKPYAEQFTVLSVDGHDPTASEIKDYRKLGEKRLKHVEDAENEGTSMPRKTLGELMMLDHATITAEDAETITFEVPLKKEDNLRLPPDKFQVFVRINKARKVFESVDCLLRKPYRTALIFKVNAGEGHLRWKPVDPRFPPVLSSISGGGSGRVAFVKIDRTFEYQRGEFQRVVPYSDRFHVKLGPLKTLDF